MYEINGIYKKYAKKESMYKITWLDNDGFTIR